MEKAKDKDNRPRCWRKVKFASEADALYSLNKITEVSDRKVKPIRAYFCSCGGWHLTSKPNKNKEPVSDALINAVRDRMKELEEKVRLLELRNGREENIAIKSNSRIKSLTEENSKLRRENNRLLCERKEVVNKEMSHSILLVKPELKIDADVITSEGHIGKIWKLEDDFVSIKLNKPDEFGSTIQRVTKSEFYYLIYSK